MSAVLVRLIIASAARVMPFDAAQACKGDKVLFEEKFEFADARLGRSERQIHD